MDNNCWKTKQWFLLFVPWILCFDFAYIYIPCLCNHFFWTLLVGCISSMINQFIHSFMDARYWWTFEWHPMDGCHSSILELYLFILWSSWMSTNIGMTFICVISLLWPTLWKHTLNNNPPLARTLNFSPCLLDFFTWKKEWIGVP
jgi:hypothetical protein